jgi:manganese/zinc/iron transport system permease protein
VLLGIVVAFLVMVYGLGMEADLSSPLLIIGAALAGVVTTALTELIYRSGLVKEDAALGLAFPLLFAISIILVSRFTEDFHLDADSVMVGEVGLAWANTNSHCFANCDPVTISPDDPRAEVGRRCVNCSTGGINPRSPEAQFEETCSNCGTFTAAEAWRERLIDAPPTLIYMPKSITVMALITLINIAFVTLFYKELKLSTFDAALAASLGFRPGLLHYALMALVSLTAVGAFDAVGAVLVVAFFILPPAAAYLLTDRLSGMLLIAPLIGVFSAYAGYDLASGNLLWWRDAWSISISAGMVIVAFGCFLLAWVLSPKYGLIVTLARRALQRQQFADQLLLGHLLNHAHTEAARAECAVDTLHEHLNWSRERAQNALRRLRALDLVRVDDAMAVLTERGERRVREFLGARG